MKANLDIEKLLEEFELVNTELVVIMRYQRRIILNIAPVYKENIIHGGIIYFIPERMFCGLFLRKNHIPVKFDLAYLLEIQISFLKVPVNTEDNSKFIIRKF
jgi:hypothetical protein